MVPRPRARGKSVDRSAPAGLRCGPKPKQRRGGLAMGAAVQVQSAVERFVSAPVRKMLIDGKWVEAASGKTFETINPATGQVLARVAEGDKEDIDRAARAARRTFDDGRWARLNPGERQRLLLKIADLIDANGDELAQLETLDNGKPFTESRHVDIPAAAETFRYYAGWVTKIYGETNPSDAAFFNFTLREPVGVCGQIIPWNFPLLMCAWKLAPALACGNTCVLKPAEQTPLTALRLGELLLEAGVPAGVVNTVPGFGPTAGGALVRHPMVGHLAFQGSTGGAKALIGGERNTAKGLEKGYYVKPTVFTGVRNDMKIAREEIFGPVVSVIPFKDENDAVLQGNDTAYGLAAGVWTRDVSKAHRVARAIRAGTVWVNCYNVFDPSSPFGGYKESGYGRELGRYAVDLYTQVKSVWLQI